MHIVGVSFSALELFCIVVSLVLIGSLQLLLRRTRLGLLGARSLTRVQAHDAGPVHRVASVLARELGWDETRVPGEIEAFRLEARQEGLELA